MRTTTIINPPCRQAPLHAAGYSLLELLVVLSIMATLMTIGSYGIKNFSKASGVSAAIPIAQGVFSQAEHSRSRKGTNTRVMMHADNRTDTSTVSVIFVIWWCSIGQDTSDDELGHCI